MNAIDPGPRWPTEYGDPAAALDSARGTLMLTTLDLCRQLAVGAGMAGSGAGAGDWARRTTKRRRRSCRRRET